MDNLELETSVQFVKGVGPVRAEQLAQLGVRTVEDLLTYYPRRFDLRRQAQPIVTLQGTEENATVTGRVVAVQDRPYGHKPFFQCTLDDGTGMVSVKWFHGSYLRDQIKEDMHIAVSGHTARFGECPQFINPRFQVLWEQAPGQLAQDELLPVYPAGGKLSSNIIGQLVKKVLPAARELILPWYRREHLDPRGLMDRPSAVMAMHRPEDKEHWNQARRRLAYDECMLMQLGLALVRAREEVRPAYALPCSGEIDRRIRARFPFAMTDAQNRAVAEIARDLARPNPANRLLQGDVGSGKTVVALYAALQAVANHKQAAIMAPTEILAQQHYNKIEQYLAGSRVRIGLLLGGQNAAQRRAVLEGLADGSIHLVVGTHALLGADVRFDQLALVIVDEQHKFGVRQRSGMRGKGYAPHYLVMTATPIPRTLSMTVFGDLDVSIIDALPPGRGKTVTRVAAAEQLPQVIAAVRQRLSPPAASEGPAQQAYFIYPLVSPSPQLELTAAQQAYQELSTGPLKDFRVGLVHGQLPQAQKEHVMREFHAGKIQVLVASVVVEVGVDVPAANTMVVMHAERFGLAQLHQLRGRIGRSAQDALCILVSSPANPVAQKRLGILEKTSDGFKIAEEDLRIRGPGEFFGTRQHGLPELKVADLLEDFELLRLARRDAFAIVAEDPALAAPHNQQLRKELLKAYAGKLDLLA